MGKTTAKQLRARQLKRRFISEMDPDLKKSLANNKNEALADRIILDLKSRISSNKYKFQYIYNRFNYEKKEIIGCKLNFEQVTFELQLNKQFNKIEVKSIENANGFWTEALVSKEKIIEQGLSISYLKNLKNNYYA